MERGEQAFLDWLRRSDRPPPEAEVPLGDDAAVWRLPSGDRVVLAADALAEGTHFDAGTAPELIGRKALAVNLSDLAAMGAAPLCAVATCALGHGFAVERAAAITAGLREAGRRWECPLVGGDTIAHSGGIVISVTVLGRLLADAPVRRSGARPGDLIAVTGALGGSILGRHLRFEPRLRESARLLELGPPSAMMDVSDGLLRDLFRLADMSGTGFRIEAGNVPVHDDARRAGGDAVLRALGDGEDFELLFTAPPAVMARIRGGWDLGTPVTVVGGIVREERVVVRDGREEPARPLGYEHG